MEAGTTLPEFDRHLELQRRAQERQLVGVRLVLVVLAAGFILLFRDRLPSLPVLLGILAAVAVYNAAIPLLLRRFPALEVGVVVTGLDMAAVSVAVYVAADAIDAYLFYGLVILGVALRFGLASAIWASVVVSFMYAAILLAGEGVSEAARILLPVRLTYLFGFGVIAGLFSRVVIDRANENARLQLRLAEEERRRALGAERELLGRMARDFGASLDLDETARRVVEGAAPHLGDATMLALVLADGGVERLRPVSAAGRDPALAERLLAFARERQQRIGEGIAGGAAGTASTLVASVGDDDGGASADPDGLGPLGLGWVVATPIAAGGRVLGVLVTVARAPNEDPGEAVVRLAESIVERAGPALQNAALLADLREQMAREQRAQRVKDDFLSIVSHELRTPLTSIQGYGQLLEARLAGEGGTDGKALAHMRVIRSQVGRMRRLVDDLLDVSRIDQRGTVSIEPADFDLADLAREAVAHVRRQYRDRRIDLVAPEQLTVHADRERIDQVLANLLENAAKYSPDGGPIELRVEPHGAEVVLRVADAGIGIPEEHLDHVFERFYQADAGASRRRFGGLGLGLYITRAIVEAHGGTIGAASNVAAGRGMVFTVRMPRIVQPPIDAALPQAGEPPPFVVRRRGPT